MSPDFVGNVTKLHATINPTQPDKWLFANKDEIDPDKSCFVRCGKINSSNNNQNTMRTSLNNTRQLAASQQTLNIAELMRAQSIETSDEPLYLFVELVTSFRVPQGARANAIEASSKQTLKDENMMKTPTIKTTPADPTRSVNSIVNALRNSKTFKLKSSMALSTTDSPNKSILNNTINDDTRSRLNASMDDGGKENDESMMRDDFNTSTFNDFKNDTADDQPLVTVEMCSGWAIIPISEIIAGGKPKNMKIQMKGGTPFLSVKITKNDIKKRPGVFNKVKRNAMKMIGMERKSILEISVTPMTSVVPKPAALTPGGVPTTTTSVNMSLNGTMNNALMIDSKETTIYPLSYYLPPYIILPTHSAPIVALYRLQLMSALKLHHDAPERVLPQSSLSLPCADVLLSNFPQFLSDIAAGRVLLYLWCKEAPQEFTKKTVNLMTTADLTNPKIYDVFRDIINLLYRAYNCVDAKPNRLKPMESIEELYNREARIKNYVNMISASNAAMSSTNNDQKGNLSSTSNNILGDADAIVMHVPFNTRELFWQQENHL